MKGLSTFAKIIGVLVILGTAGSCDLAEITYEKAIAQIAWGVGLILAGCVLPHLWKGLRRMAVMLFCVR